MPPTTTHDELDHQHSGAPFPSSPPRETLDAAGDLLRALAAPAGCALLMAVGVWLTDLGLTRLGADWPVLLPAKVAVGVVLYAVASSLWMDELPVRPLEAVRLRLRALLLRPWRPGRAASPRPAERA